MCSTPLRYIPSADARDALRLPRFSEGQVEEFSAEICATEEPEYLIYISYQWLHKDLVARTTALDDLAHSQHRRILKAVDDFRDLDPENRHERLGLWIVSSTHDAAS